MLMTGSGSKMLGRFRTSKYLWRITIQTTECSFERDTQLLTTVLLISMCNSAKKCYLVRTSYSWKVESARGVKKT